MIILIKKSAILNGRGNETIKAQYRNISLTIRHYLLPDETGAAISPVSQPVRWALPGRRDSQ
jgi:hypothetical protein